MIRYPWRVSISAGFALIAVAMPICAPAQEQLIVAERLALNSRATIEIFELLGRSPLVMRTVSSVLGPDAAKALLAKSPAEIGHYAVANDKIALQLASRLPSSQKLDWASIVNSVRLDQQAATSHEIEQKYLQSRIEKIPNADLFVYLPPTPQTSRTFSISPIGDVNLEPSLKIPLLRVKSNQIQFEAKSIPVGKTAVAVTGSTAAAEICEEKCRQHLIELLSRTIASAASPQHDSGNQTVKDPGGK